MTFIAIISLIILIFKLPRIKRWYRLYHWKKSIRLTQRYQQFQSIFQSIKGFQLSRQARQSNDQMAYTYGEIEFDSFIALLSHANLHSNSIFCDLGAGIGKAVIATILVYEIKQAIGIEILPLVHQGAEQAKLNLASLEPNKAIKVQFILGDFLDTIPSNSTIVFINASAFFGELWHSIMQRLESLTQLETIVSTKSFSSPRWKLSYHSAVTMSWGLVDAWVYTAKSHCNHRATMQDYLQNA